MGELLESSGTLFSIGRFEKTLRRGGLPGTKQTVANYLRYLQDAFFIFTHEKFSHSPRKRLMNPKKVYLADTGFAALGRSFSENRGRVLENAVAIELHRRGEEVFYFKGRHECDFILRRGRHPTEAIQVCWQLDTHSERRELAGLREAARSLNLQRLTVLTFDQRDELEAAGRAVRVVPAWEWMARPP